MVNEKLAIQQYLYSTRNRPSMSDVPRTLMHPETAAINLFTMKKDLYDEGRQLSVLLRLRYLKSLSSADDDCLPSGQSASVHASSCHDDALPKGSTAY